MTMTKTIWRQVREQLGDIAKIEVLVGIPTFNNAKTVEPVVKAVKAGISKVCPTPLYWWSTRMPGHRTVHRRP